MIKHHMNKGQYSIKNKIPLILPVFLIYFMAN